MRDLGDELA